MAKGIRFITFYLPQYHTINENDIWWGKGFTEWVRVKHSKPVFEGHYQPRIPDAYYDLADIKVMADQAEQAKAYGIYGFCYYHYWFNGNLLLEKPLEQMLACKEVDIPFCLSWANEKWTRAWEGNSKEVLIDQYYGGEDEWEKHLDYLLPYFLDQRYITINRMPVFVIYRTESFADFDKMFSFWNSKMKEKGYPEIYFIEMLTSYQKKPMCSGSRGVVEFEPMFTIGDGFSVKAKIRGYIKKKYPFLFRRPYKLFDYDKVWQKIVKRSNSYKNKTLFLGAFTDWDNSPRFRDRGTIFRSVTPKKFQYYLTRQTQKSDSGFLFINAWNEWAEGAYLEPDKMYGDEFLKAVKKVADGSTC